VSGVGRDRVLGYAFVPVPYWISIAWEHGEISEDAFRVQQVLFRRANHSKLADRSETPRLRIETLAVALRRQTDRTSLESLKRLLRDYRSDGLLGFRTEGTGAVTVYVFTLYPDGPRRSAVVPAFSAQVGPGAKMAETRSGSQSATDVAGDLSAPTAPENPTSVPRDSVSVPPSEVAANPVYERDSADAPVERVPPPSELSEQDKPSGKEDMLKGAASVFKVEGEAGQGHSPTEPLLSDEDELAKKRTQVAYWRNSTGSQLPDPVTREQVMAAYYVELLASTDRMLRMVRGE
jgi:hypothetical protein